jgi:hypothetical protein
MPPSIYIYKEECLSVCLFVRYAFGPCDSYRHQTFYETSLGPEKSLAKLGTPEGGKTDVLG